MEFNADALAETPTATAFVPLVTAPMPSAVLAIPLALALTPAASELAPVAFAPGDRNVAARQGSHAERHRCSTGRIGGVAKCDGIDPRRHGVGAERVGTTGRCVGQDTHRHGISPGRLALAPDRSGVPRVCRHVRADGDGALLKGAPSRKSAVAKIDGVDRSRGRLEADGDGILLACDGAIALGKRIQSGRCCPKPERGGAQPGRPGHIADRRRVHSIGTRVQAKGRRACGCNRVDANGA
jgi:hypothetical protein